MIDTSKVEIEDFEGIDHSDHPDYCDAYPVSATYDGKEMTDDELEELTEKHPDFIYEKLWDYIF